MSLGPAPMQRRGPAGCGIRRPEWWEAALSCPREGPACALGCPTSLASHPACHQLGCFLITQFWDLKKFWIQVLLQTHFHPICSLSFHSLSLLKSGNFKFWRSPIYLYFNGSCFRCHVASLIVTGFVYFSLQFYQTLFYMFSSSLIGCTNFRTVMSLQWIDLYQSGMTFLNSW